MGATSKQGCSEDVMEIENSMERWKCIRVSDSECYLGAFIIFCLLYEKFKGFRKYGMHIICKIIEDI